MERKERSRSVRGCCTHALGRGVSAPECPRYPGGHIVPPDLAGFRHGRYEWSDHRRTRVVVRRPECDRTERRSAGPSRCLWSVQQSKGKGERWHNKVLMEIMVVVSASRHYGKVFYN